MGKKERQEIYGTKADWKRAAESVAVGVKGLAKELVGADSSAEQRRLDELIEESERRGR